MSTIGAMFVFAAEAADHESDQTLYYVLGGGLALYALLVSAVGIKRHEGWPASDATKHAVMALTTLVVLAAMASAVITA